jgi:hypothetical protein
MNEYLELEYKYEASDVKLTDFMKLADELNPVKKIDVSSWDVYFTKPGVEGAFQRYRESDTPELTKKVKTRQANNWERIEIDLPLDSSRINEKLVTTYVGLDGYVKNFKIYKSCFIYWFENTNMVYYTVYDENMKEIGRYLEVEVNKDSLKNISVDKLKEELETLEKKLEILGVTKKNRMKRSLFEIYKKEDK